MHPAWHIEDIRRMILAVLEPRDMARLAQTCTTLFDTFIQDSWATAKTMSQFLQTLPPTSRHRPLRSDDIERMAFYSSAVQCLEVGCGTRNYPLPLAQDGWKVEKKTKCNVMTKRWEDLWSEIAALRPQSDFLPNLRRLRVLCVNPDLLTPLVGISGSNLTYLCMKYKQDKKWEGSVKRLLDGLQDTPNLKYLLVGGGEDLVPPRLVKQSPLKYLRIDRSSHHKLQPDSLEKKRQLYLEVLRKSELRHLTIGLTLDWYSPEIHAMKAECLPSLKTLWLDLTTFEHRSYVSPGIDGSPDDCTCYASSKELVALPGRPHWCCGKPPSYFLRKLDKPELEVLNIKFRYSTTGSMFLDVMSAAKDSCRLQNLVELDLSGGGWRFEYCCSGECYVDPPDPQVTSEDIRMAMSMLLPLPRLQTLKITVTANALRDVELERYKHISDGIPALEKLYLHHRDLDWHERTQLHHIAAFCSMFPVLSEVSIGTVPEPPLHENLKPEWISPNVRKVIINWSPRRVRRVRSVLKWFFPNASISALDGEEDYYRYLGNWWRNRIEPLI